jgi:hypothetical protein
MALACAPDEASSTQALCLMDHQFTIDSSLPYITCFMPASPTNPFLQISLPIGLA